MLLLAMCLGNKAAFAQVKYDLLNEVGATAPCVGIGIGVALAKKCATWAEREGFVRVGDVGTDGLTIGSDGKDDGVITGVQTGSPAAMAGFLVGDRILSVDGRAAQWTPAMEVAHQAFGERGKPVQLTVTSAAAGASKQIELVRGEAPAPPGVPKSDSMFVQLTPLVDWRGRFVPCSSAGPLGAATVAFCVSHFKPWSYVRVKELGSIGFALDSGAKDSAVVSSVDPASSAAKAGLAIGDKVLAVDGKPLAGSAGALARERLFGKAGDAHAVLVERGGSQVSMNLVLARKTS